MKRALMVYLKIYQDFSPYPGARYYTDGPLSGEEFYFTCLRGFYQRASESSQKLSVNLDGTAGYASSFLSESFGLLAEEFGINNVLKNIEIISKDEPDWEEKIINDYIPNAHKRKRKDDTKA